MKKILILCTGNSCRSQIAHGYFAYFGKDTIDVFSAGIETHGVNPRAIATMEEDGIDISEHTSNHVDEYLHIPFDYILTVCDHANEHCPYIPSQTALRIHHNFTDPSKQVSENEEEIKNAFAATREEIKNFALKFVQQHRLKKVSNA